MNNFLYYAIAIWDYERLFPNVQRPFLREIIATKEQKNIVATRAVAILAFTSLMAYGLRNTVFCWPVALTGTAFTGRKIYSYLLSKDPLMEAFYKITGGRERFEALPEINIRQGIDEKISMTIRRINWENLIHRISKAKTLDGRNVIIVKGLDYNEGIFNGTQRKAVLAFIEKTGPEDFENQSANLQESFHTIMNGLINGYYFDELNYFERYLHRISSGIFGDLANDLYSQLAIPAQ
jgi:hypothetical protein